MKMNRTLPLAGALAMFAALAGCSQESNPGGPGVTNAPRTTTNSSMAQNTNRMNADQRVAQTREADKPVVTEKGDTFTLKAPSMTTTIDAGKKKDIDITISRGHDFVQGVKVQIKAPAGVTVTPQQAELLPGQDKLTVSVQATNTAQAGKTQLDVTGTPETGKAVSLEVPIEVKHAS